MSLGDDLRSTVKNIFQEQWSRRTGRVVPTAETVQLGNEGVVVDGVVLYADMSESTQLVDKKTDEFSITV